MYYIIFPSKAPKDEKPFPRAKEIGTQFPSSSDTTMSSPILQKALVSTCYNNENKTVLVSDANEIPEITPASVINETLNVMNGSVRRDSNMCATANIGIASKNLPSMRTVLSFRNEKGSDAFSSSSGTYEMGNINKEHLDSEKNIRKTI